MSVLFAEYQTGGRGRRGRSWLSPFGSGLCLSLTWRFDAVPPDLPAIGIAAGIGLRRALSDTGADGLKLKWPNDIVVKERKLAGLLFDMTGELTGPIDLVIGVGVNILVTERLSEDVARAKGLEPVGLADLVGANEVSRNEVGANIVAALRYTLEEFRESGISRYRDEWERYDFLYGKNVTVQSGTKTYAGTARGIAEDGSLMLESASGVQFMLSGEVTLNTF